jgi:hypothetical protein
VDGTLVNRKQRGHGQVHVTSGAGNSHEPEREHATAPARHIGGPGRRGRVGALRRLAKSGLPSAPRQTSLPSTSTRWRPSPLSIAASSGNSLQSRPGRRAQADGQSYERAHMHVRCLLLLVQERGVDRR